MRDAVRTTRRELLSFRKTPARAPIPLRSLPARILEHHCLAYTGSFCSVCKERCPEPGAVVVSQGKPTIVGERCTGCGLCADACPAPFGGAIAVLRKESVHR